MRWLLVGVVLLSACGDDDFSGFRDARPIDTFVPPDAPPISLQHHHYVIDSLAIPTTNTQAREYGLDLNGDATVDNQLGQVFSTLASMGISFHAATATAVDNGSVIHL